MSKYKQCMECGEYGYILGLYCEKCIKRRHDKLKAIIEELAAGLEEITGEGSKDDSQS